MFMLSPHKLPNAKLQDHLSFGHETGTEQNFRMAVILLPHIPPKITSTTAVYLHKT